MIDIRYHVDREFRLVIPVDGRTGQLATGQLSAGGDQIDLGNILNSEDVAAGDFFRLVASEPSLSGNPDAEIISNNTGPHLITEVDGNLITLEDALNDEPNSEEGKFFEYEIIRKSPYRKFTFERADQGAFDPDFLAVNGDLVDPDVSEDDDVVTVSGGFGSLTFTPLGSDRWSCEMAITTDGVIEIGIDSGLIQIRMSNFNVIQDAQTVFFGSDASRYGAKVVQTLTAVERLAGAFWLQGEPPGVAVEVFSTGIDRQVMTRGATNEVIYRVVTSDNRFPPRLEGGRAFVELRRQSDQELVLVKELRVVGAGILMGTFDPSESVEGSYTGMLRIHLGGVPDKIMRTRTFPLRFA